MALLTGLFASVPTGLLSTVNTAAMGITSLLGSKTSAQRHLTQKWSHVIKSPGTYLVLFPIKSLLFSLSSNHTGLWLFLHHPKHARATTIWASHQLFPGPGKRFPPTPASTHSFISFRSSLKSHHFHEANSKHLINTATCPPSPCCLLPCSAFVPTAFVISKKTYSLLTDCAQCLPC